MATLAESQRGEGETALPSLGDIISAMQEAREVWPNFAEGRKEVLTLPVYAGQEQKRLTK
jgi:hypothetical protein